jgi:metallo-beta-lactamase family protein
MRIDLCGAAGEVTGSGYLVDTGRARVLVDFGMFQGRGATDARNRDLGPVDPAHLDAIVLTHAHLDHTGRLPLLAQRLPRECRIHATAPTIDLTQLILEDSARIQVGDHERELRYARPGERVDPPLYAHAEVDAVTERMSPVPVWTPEERRNPAHCPPGALADGDGWHDIADGVRIRMREAGHILGSASVEMDAKGRDGTRRIVFSGDIGQRDTPIHPDPDPPSEADLVFLESTYGDRNHRPFGETVAEFQSIIRVAAWDRAKVLIPAFAVGRTQILLWSLSELFRRHAMPRIPIYLDSPMAARASEIYRTHPCATDAETRALQASGAIERGLRTLRVLETSSQSRALNDEWGSSIIIAGSGTCDGGRIMHHLLHNVWKQGVQMVATGFMPEGSLGRRLIEGARSVRILGRSVEVRAKIRTLGGFSAHAGRDDLLWWHGHLKDAPRTVLTHGEQRQRDSLAAALRERGIAAVDVPARGAVIEL